jgi:predicted nucleic acid-binding protein
LPALYGQITFTSVIAEEYGQSLPDWIKIQDPKDQKLVQKITNVLDKGEASGIGLAVELDRKPLLSGH